MGQKLNKVLFTVPFPRYFREEIFSFFKEKGLDYDFYNEKGDLDVPDLSVYDIVICYNPFPKLDFNHAKNLELLLMVSTGVDQLPDYILDREDLIITNNYGGYGVPISEWILMTALMGMKNLPAIVDRSKNKNWGIQVDLLELRGKKVLIFGAGAIGSEAAKRFRVFGARTSGYRRSGRPNPDFDRIVSSEELDSELKQADIVVMTLPSTPETYHMLDYEKISLIRDDAVLINVSRGSTIDEKALISHIEDGKFRFVALDVFEKEPLDENSPLWDIERVFVSTHTCWMSDNRDKVLFNYIKNTLNSFLDTGSVERPLNKGKRY